MKIAVLSDTHAPRFWKQCPKAVASNLQNVDLILHAGDVCRASVLDELASFAPVHAVLGNNDGTDIAAWGATETFEQTIAGLNVAMIHDGGQKQARLTRLQKRFPNAQLVVFGHSHIPLHEQSGGFHIFNPGSPTDKRRQPHKTMGLLEIVDGQLKSIEIVNVDS